MLPIGPTIWRQLVRDHTAWAQMAHACAADALGRQSRACMRGDRRRAQGVDHHARYPSLLGFDRQVYVPQHARRALAQPRLHVP